MLKNTEKGLYKIIELLCQVTAYQTVRKQKDLWTTCFIFLWRTRDSLGILSPLLVSGGEGAHQTKHRIFWMPVILYFPYVKVRFTLLTDFFFSPPLAALQRREFPGPGIKPHHSSDPSRHSDNTGSLIHCAMTELQDVFKTVKHFTTCLRMFIFIIK